MSTLQRGSKGSDVKKMQGYLRDVGAQPRPPVTGTFEIQTDKALRDFQKKNGLRVTGQLDSKTAKLLKEEATKPLVWTIKDTKKPNDALCKEMNKEMDRYAEMQRIVKRLPMQDEDVSWGMRNYEIYEDTFVKHCFKMCQTLEDIDKMKKDFDKAPMRAFKDRTLTKAKRAWDDLEERNTAAAKLKRECDREHKRFLKAVDKAKKLAA